MTPKGSTFSLVMLLYHFSAAILHCFNFGTLNAAVDFSVSLTL